MERFQETIRLFKLYMQEAHRCREANAPLAGCVILASALEAALLIMCGSFPDEVLLYRQNHKGESLRPVEEWGLSKLLSLAKELKWLPCSEKNSEEIDPGHALVGDYVELVRVIRNLVHPSIYLKEYAGESLSNKHLDLSFTVLNVACAHLAARLKETLGQESEPFHEDTVTSV